MIPSLLSEQFPVMICLVFLIYASWLDKRTGLVPNKFWLVVFVSDGLVSSIECVTRGSVAVIGKIIVSLPIAFLLSLVLFYLKVFYGSDAKALISLSLIVPTLTPLLNSSSPSLFTSLSTVTNFVILLSLLIASISSTTSSYSSNVRIVF